MRLQVRTLPYADVTSSSLSLCISRGDIDEFVDRYGRVGRAMPEPNQLAR